MTFKQQEQTMKHINRWMAAAAIIAALQLWACAETPVEGEGEEKAAKVEPVEGAEVSKVTLTAEAVQALDIQNAQVQDEQINGKQRKVIPYAAVLYDPEGATWAFTNPEPLVYVRQPIKVDYIEGDRAVLLDGPASGTAVVTVGAEELFGAEIGVGE
jgi:hypothetical protein